MTASVGDRIEVLFNTGTSKGYDLYAGEIVSHSLGKVHRIVAPTLTPPTHSREPSDTSIQLSVQVYRVHFDDGTSGELDLGDESSEWWRPEPAGEAAELRRAAARTARHELAARDQYVGIKQERDAVVSSHEARLHERAAAALVLELALHRAAPPHRRVVPADAPKALVTSWGQIAFDLTNQSTPEEAERVLEQWARPHAGEADLRAWLVGALPFDLAAREQAYRDTGLVLLAGHLDQTGAGENNVRTLFDDFGRNAVEPVLICPLPPDGHASRPTTATEVHWEADPDAPPVLIAARPLTEHPPTAAELGLAGALPSANLFVFAHSMPQPGRRGSLGAVVEIGTGYEGWQVTAALHPSVQAHGNALLGARDRPGAATARIVAFTTAREAAAVRRSVSLPARDRQSLRDVLASDMEQLADIEVAHTTPAEFVGLVRASLLGEADPCGHTDGATGGQIVYLVRG